MTAFTPGQIIERYLALRAKKQAMAAEMETAIKPYDAALEQLEGAMLQAMLDAGVKNFSTDAGTAYQSTTQHVRLVDRHEIIGGLEKGEVDLDIFTNAVSKDYILTYVEANGRPPAGVELTQMTNVRFRKA